MNGNSLSNASLASLVAAVAGFAFSSAHVCDAIVMAVAKKKVELSFQILPTEAVRPWFLNVFTNTVIASSF
ncbi:hypothetical protein D3C73_1049070 [compost metagenome]